MKTASFIVLFFLVELVSAQVPARGIKVGDGYADFPTDKLLEATNIYFSGDWAKLQQSTIDLLKTLQFHASDNSYSNDVALDFERHYYSVAFVYTAPDKSEDVLRFLVHSPPTEPYVSRIPGIKAGDRRKFYEVFLTLNPKDILISTYYSTREKSPLESQIPKFLKQFDPKVLENLTAAIGPSKRIYAVLSRIDLPFSRASIEVEDVVQRPEDKVTTKSKIFNRPLTRFSFGLVSSLVLSSSESDTRATIQSGNLTEDPLRGPMPMGVVNIHPWRYDADLEDVSWKERFRLFAGGILSPDFGFSAGGGLQLIRGFSVNAGVGLLFIDTLKAGEELGEKPVDSDDPFEYGTATAFFFGVGYNF
jgi:hypothetical protein